MRTRFLITSTVVAFAASGLGSTAAPPADDTGRLPLMSRQETADYEPRWPNPHLSLLPAAAEPNWQYWKSHMFYAAQDRRVTRRAAEDPAATWEHEAPGATGFNDAPGTAERLVSFSSELGHGAVDVVGRLRSVPLVLAPSQGADGAIPIARTLTVAPRGEVSIQGMVGDGLFGSASQTPSGDFDFYKLNVQIGQRLRITVLGPATPEPTLDPAVALYRDDGAILEFNDNALQSGISFVRNSYLTHTADSSGDYFIAVMGSNQGILLPTPLNPFDPASGQGAVSEGTYELIVGLDIDEHDRDCFSAYLRAGDVISANLSGSGLGLSLRSLDDRELVSSTGADLSAIYPPQSPLAGGGNSALANLSSQDGWYALCVNHPIGRAFVPSEEYLLELRLARPGLENPAAHGPQLLYIDFDGAVVDRAIFGGHPGTVVLSPLANFLPAFGIEDDQLDPLIDAILDRVAARLDTEIRHLGVNGDYWSSQLVGDFAIDIRNSRDHPDSFGDPQLSRVIVGGSIEELGLSTIAIAQSVDPGNFAGSETAVVLLDLLSGDPDDPNSLNGIQRAENVSKLSLVATTLAHITAHEAGHLFANFHTDRDGELEMIMDRGGRLSVIIGLGDDDVFGSADDVTVDFRPDAFEPAEGLHGTEDALNWISWGLPYAGEKPWLTVSPPILDFGPIAVGELVVGELELKNRGSVAVQISGSTLAHGTSGFDVANTAIVLQPGQSRWLNVGFAATGPTQFADLLVISSDDPRAREIAVPLHGQGGIPQLQIEPAQLDFGTVVYGFGPEVTQEILVIRNQGDGDLFLETSVITGMSPQSFRAGIIVDRLRVQPGTSGFVPVLFDPAGAVGAHAARICFLSNDPAAPVAGVELAGHAVGPDIEISPRSPYGFGATRPGTLKQRVFVVLNNGPHDLAVLSARIQGAQADQFMISAGLPPASLGYRETHRLTAEFRPTRTGSCRSQLVIESNDPDEGSLVVELSGEGVAPEIETNPQQLQFEAIHPWPASQKTLRVRNIGSDVLSVSSLRIDNDPHTVFSLVSVITPFTLLPESSKDFSLEFAPGNAGQYTAQLVISSDDADQPQLVIPLTGIARPTAQSGPSIPALSPMAYLLFAALIALAARFLLRRSG